MYHRFVKAEGDKRILDLRSFMKIYGELDSSGGHYEHLVPLVEAFAKLTDEGIEIAYKPENKPRTKKKDINYLTQYRVIKDAYLALSRPPALREELYQVNEAFYGPYQGCLSQFYKYMCKEFDILDKLREREIYMIDDAISDALEGLVEACATYPIAMQKDLMTYAEPFMRKCIRHGAMEARNPDLPDGKLADDYYMILKLHDKYMLEQYDEKDIPRLIYKDMRKKEEMITEKMILQALDYRQRYEEPVVHEEESLNPFMSAEAFARTHLYASLRPCFRLRLHDQFVRIFERMEDTREELIIFIYDLNGSEAKRVEEIAALEEKKAKGKYRDKKLLDLKLRQAYDKAIRQASHEYTIDMRKDAFQQLYPQYQVNDLEEEAYDEMIALGGEELTESYHYLVDHFIKIRVIE